MRAHLPRRANVADARVAVLALWGALALGCTQTSPTGPSAAPAFIPTRPLVVAGQSNAVNVAPSIRAVYPLPVFSEATQNGAAISVWDETEHPPVMWTVLAEELRQPVQAFVWWQGEGDRDNPHYLDDDRALVARVRAAAGDPQLLVILVRVLDLPQNAGVRAAQEALVAGDVNAVLVSSDGPAFEDGASDHLTAAGYAAVARRIVSALR